MKTESIAKPKNESLVSVVNQGLADCYIRQGRVVGDLPNMQPTGFSTGFQSDLNRYLNRYLKMLRTFGGIIKLGELIKQNADKGVSKVEFIGGVHKSGSGAPYSSFTNVTLTDSLGKPVPVATFKGENYIFGDRLDNPSLAKNNSIAAGIDNNGLFIYDDLVNEIAYDHFEDLFMEDNGGDNATQLTIDQNLLNLLYDSGDKSIKDVYLIIQQGGCDMAERISLRDKAAVADELHSPVVK